MEVEASAVAITRSEGGKVGECGAGIRNVTKCQSFDSSFDFFSFFRD